MPEEIKWAHSAPAHVLQFFVVDPWERFLIMHRTDKVRSAKNVWSIPSGTHELGEEIGCCIARELEEEYGLEAEEVSIVGQYENIAGDRTADLQYHWIMSLYVVYVSDVTLAVNKEPDKHDKMLFLPVDTIVQPSFLDEYKFHESLSFFLETHAHTIMAAIKSFVWQLRVSKNFEIPEPELEVFKPDSSEE